SRPRLRGGRGGRDAGLGSARAGAAGGGEPASARGPGRVRQRLRPLPEPGRGRPAVRGLRGGSRAGATGAGPGTAGAGGDASPAAADGLTAHVGPALVVRGFV